MADSPVGPAAAPRARGRSAGGGGIPGGARHPVRLVDRACHGARGGGGGGAAHRARETPDAAAPLARAVGPGVDPPGSDQDGDPGRPRGGSGGRAGLRSLARRGERAVRRVRRGPGRGVAAPVGGAVAGHPRQQPGVGLPQGRPGATGDRLRRRRAGRADRSRAVPVVRLFGRAAGGRGRPRVGFAGGDRGRRRARVRPPARDGAGNRARRVVGAARHRADLVGPRPGRDPVPAVAGVRPATGDPAPGRGRVPVPSR